MTWYEPKNRPPSSGSLDQSRSNDTPANPHHRACDEVSVPDNDELDISNYINEQWNYPNRGSLVDKENHSSSNYYGGDRLQFRVEQHLSNMFQPCSSYFTSSEFRTDRFHFGNQYSNDNHSDPIKVNETTTDGSALQIDAKDILPTSKANQFFYPRPVNAIMRYKGFFSPLVADNNQVDEKDYDNRGHDTRDNDSNFKSNFLNPTYNTVHQHDDDSPLELKENASLPPESGKGSSTFINLHNSYRTTPPVQSTITQNAKTGTLGFSFSECDAKSTKKQKKKTWDDFGGGGRATVNVQQDVDGGKKQSKEVSKKPKRKKRSSSKEEEHSKVENLFNNMDASKKTKKRQSAPENEPYENTTKRSKQKTPAVTIEQVSIKSSSKPQAIKMEDFQGLEEMSIWNAAECDEGLQFFLRAIGKQKYATWTMLFLDKHFGPKVCNGSRAGKSKKKGSGVKKSGKFDLPQVHQGYQISTAFFPTSKKYCTEKGPPCSSWNCTCDNQIRAKRSTAPLLGAMFLFKDNASHELQCYILPLGPTDGETETALVYDPRMSDWPTVPFNCEVPLEKRWTALKAILSLRNIKLATYNAVVSLLPVYRHLDQATSILDEDMFNECMIHLSGELWHSRSEKRHIQPLAPDTALYSIWDLRLVTWMLRPDSKDADLEFGCIEQGFTHLMPDVPDPCNDALAALARGIFEAKKNLILINNLHPIMHDQLVQNDLLPALEKIEAPVQSLLSAMEYRGIAFYPNRLLNAQSQLEGHVQQLEEESRRITKDADFLLSSPQQVSAFLFDVLKLSMPAGLVTKTKEGSSHRSTSEETLNAMRAEMILRTGKPHPFIDVVLKFRRHNKMLTGFIKPLPGFCYKEQPEDFYPRIHPQWMQTAARTGRLSCRKPNLQQVPKSKETNQGADPRNAFVTTKGKKQQLLFACDYGQKEVRILAHMCGDEALRSLFRDDNNIDIYKQMASLIRNKPIETIGTDERAQFKQVTLAILYGMSPRQVAKKLNISEDAAKRTMNDFFHKFSTLKRWMDATKKFAREHRYVTTISGRKRYLDAINSDDRALKSQAERQAINTVIQGSAADMMKTAMINMAENLKQWKGPAADRPKMLLQIHDELILELKFDSLHLAWMKEIAIKSCCRDCEKIFGLTVPLLLDCTCGLTWKNMRPVGDAKG